VPPSRYYERRRIECTGAAGSASKGGPKPAVREARQLEQRSEKVLRPAPNIEQQMKNDHEERRADRVEPRFPQFYGRKRQANTKPVAGTKGFRAAAGVRCGQKRDPCGAALKPKLAPSTSANLRGPTM